MTPGRSLRGAALAPALLALATCARPIPLTDERILVDLAARYRDFHAQAGDANPTTDADLVRPRLGLPAIARAGDAFAIEWLERGGASLVRAALVGHDEGPAAAARCLGAVTGSRARLEVLAGAPMAASLRLDPPPPARPEPGCLPLALVDEERRPLGAPGVTRVTARALPADPVAAPPAGSYDLVFDSGNDAPFRAARAVWLEDRDPAAARPLRVALLSDTHVGKKVLGLEEHLARVIDEINAAAPDLVVLTGDVANLGQDLRQEERAARFLERIAAPMLVIIGNHDHGFGIAPNFRQGYGPGYWRFARSFHPLLYYEVTVGGWRWVGFDSGPQVVAPTINNRGLAPETLVRIGDALAESRRGGQRGVVLFSHCASRASLGSSRPTARRGGFGRMYRGGRELEARELAAAAGGQRVLHLAGHTHWNDLFEARRRGDRWRYELVPGAPSERGPRTLRTPAAIVTVQSATHPGILKESARGYGYALLELGAGDPQLEYVRHFDHPSRPRPADPFTSTR